VVGEGEELDPWSMSGQSLPPRGLSVDLVTVMHIDHTFCQATARASRRAGRLACCQAVRIGASDTASEVQTTPCRPRLADHPVQTTPSKPPLNSASRHLDRHASLHMVMFSALYMFQSLGLYCVHSP